MGWWYQNHFALRSQWIEKDVEEQSKAKGADPKDTKFGIFVLHDKQKQRKQNCQMILWRLVIISLLVLSQIAGLHTHESTDIVYHQMKAEEQGNDVFLPSSTLE